MNLRLSVLPLSLLVLSGVPALACGPEGNLARGGRGFNPGLTSAAPVFDIGGIVAAQQSMGAAAIAQVNGHRQMLAAQAAARRERMRPVRLARAERLREVKLARRAKKREYILAKEAERRRAKAEAERNDSPDEGRVMLASTFPTVGR